MATTNMTNFNKVDKMKQAMMLLDNMELRLTASLTEKGEKINELLRENEKLRNEKNALTFIVLLYAIVCCFAVGALMVALQLHV